MVLAVTGSVVVDDLRPNPATGRYRREDGVEFDLAYDAEHDLYVSSDGAKYVQNLNRLADPVYLRVAGDVWRARYQGTTLHIDWSEVGLPDVLKSELKDATMHRLRSQSPRLLGETRSLASALPKTDHANRGINRSLGEWSAGELTACMLSLKETHSRSAGSAFRKCYRTLVQMGLAGATSTKLEQLEHVRMSGREALTNVRTWDPRKGALTTAELEVLRLNLLPQLSPETDTEHFARVLLRTLTVLGRRPSQILAVAADGVARLKPDHRIPAVIWFPGAKSQRNDPPRPYDVPDDLYDDLMALAARPRIKSAQQSFGYFFVTPEVTQTRMAGPRSAANIMEGLHDWIAKRGIISPRTGKPLHITPTRLRHTVATQLARKGWSKEDIQEFLEHQGDSAVLAYLDAVGNDMAPALERADRALGGLFTDITNTFQGKVVSRPAGKIEKPILIPDPKNRAIVGQCGMSGTCPKSPFAACLNGCPHFLFFKDADVDAMRAHIHAEHERWRRAEGNAQRTRVQDDFARMDAGLTEAQRVGKVTDGQH